MVNSPANASYMHDVSMNMADTEPDIYYYNFNGHSGQFTYDQSNNIYQMPQTGLKITRVGTGFQIVDENGNIYTFGHELIHANHIVNGQDEQNKDSGKADPDGSKETLTKEEVKTRTEENKLRAEHNVTLRKIP